jgi:benzil reductase ((S)-benzoin forming)
MEAPVQASSEAHSGPASPGKVLITGASRGIGNALARKYLAAGFRVFGLSRTLPVGLLRHPHYTHVSVDLARTDALCDVLRHRLIREHELFDLSHVFLNAGMFSLRIADLKHVPLSELTSVMDINVWSNKVILDTLLGHEVSIGTCVVSSSIAGARARAGNSAYAISKAALNIMMALYALENPQTYFAVLGLCNVHTELARRIGSLPLEGSFPEIEKLRQRGAASGYLASADERAAHLFDLLALGLKERVPSGQFTEIRSLIAQPWFMAKSLELTP